MLSVSILITIIVFVVLIYLVTKVDKKDADVRERVRRLGEEEGVDAIEILQPTLTLDEEVTPLVKSQEGILKSLGISIDRFKEENQMRFQQAGLTSPSAPILYLFFKYIVSGLLVLLAILMLSSSAHGLQKVLTIMMGITCIGAGIFGPDIYVRNATQKRQHVLQRSFPDSLDLLLVCVESGLALDGALARVCRELGRAHPEITAEFNRTRMELTLLNNRALALQNLSDRTGLLPFRSLVATLLQSEKFGTNLSETLRVLAEDYRIARMMAAENKAGRLPVMMTIPLICLMMPAFFIIIMGPAILSVIEVFKNR